MPNSEFIQARKEMLNKGKQKHVIIDGNDVPEDDPKKGSSLSPLIPPNPNSKKNNISPSGKASQDKLGKIKGAREDNKEQIGPEIKRTKLSEKMALNAQIKKDEAKKQLEINKKNATGEIDYGKLDLRGNPAISFDPNSKERKSILALLGIKAHTKGVKVEQLQRKEKLIEKLGSEFARIYQRYRNLLLSSKGRKPVFLLPDTWMKECKNIAVMCVLNAITPRQLLEYWGNRLEHFAPGTFPFKFPTLNFLQSSFAIEQAVSAVYESTNGKINTWKPGDFSNNKKEDAHAFFDTNSLDKKLKDGLKKAGFDVGDGSGYRYNDRYLLSVQKTAMAISTGKSLYVGGEMKCMVDWALDNLYGRPE